MSFNPDEEYARRLQAEFDDEDKSARRQMDEDWNLARELASQAHSLSDSEDEEISEIRITNGSEQKGSLENVQDDITSPCCKKQKLQEDDEAVQPDKKPCKYGAQCYRKNPLHFEEFWHPSGDGSQDSAHGESSGSSSSDMEKKSVQQHKSVDHLNHSLSSKSFLKRWEASAPFYYFLNKAYSISETHRDPFTLVLPDLLHPGMGTLIESVQINFMVDLDYVMKFYKAAKIDNAPLLIMYGELEGQPSRYPSVICNKVVMPFQYGVHHSKIMIFHYKEGLRAVIHTANLVSDDWEEKTQGFWVSPLFPRIDAPSFLNGESTTRFKRDFVDYLLAYKNPDLTRWTHIVKSHDFSSCQAVFIGSAPGYHISEARHKWGHAKVRVLLRKHCSSSHLTSVQPVIAQCSSIGGLGKDARSWLTGELGVSLSGRADGGSSQVNLIFPSEDDVRESSQGYLGGSCLPYNSKTHSKQTWLTDHLHHWRSECRGRTRGMPHIKTYTRLSKDLKEAPYFLITSANLSKAAWGQLQKQGTQLFIASFEAGVLLLPKFLVGGDSFKLGNSPMGISTEKKEMYNGRLFLPYDVPLTKYSEGSIPWLVDTKKTKPDVFGIIP